MRSLDFPENLASPCRGRGWSPEQVPQVLSLPLPTQLPEWISQIQGSFLPGIPGDTDRSLDQAEASPHLWGVCLSPSSTWWSPTLPTDGQIHSRNCAKLLCRGCSPWQCL